MAETINDYKSVPEPAFSALAELEQFIGDTDGKTVCTPINSGEAFIDDGTIDADDAVKAFNVLAAILSLPASEPEWQPIETAPKDGSWVLGYESRIGMNTKYVPHEVMRWRWNLSEASTGVWRNSGDRLVEPTHWRPLPAPPREAT